MTNKRVANIPLEESVMDAVGSMEGKTVDGLSDEDRRVLFKMIGRLPALLAGRGVPLPPQLQGRDVTGARCDDGRLIVRFEAQPTRRANASATLRPHASAAARTEDSIACRRSDATTRSTT